MSEWKKYTVQDLINQGMLAEPMDGNHGNIHPKSSDYVSKGIPFVMANDLSNGIVDLINCSFISEEQAKSLKKGFAHPDDVLLTHKATIGRTAIVPNDYDTIILTPQVTYYRVLKGIDNYYLKYYFDSAFFQNTIKNWACSGSTRAYIGIMAQRKLPIILPSLDIQKKIASILYSLDKKIALNTAINDNLEQQAQAIFKAWFVDFLPFGGVMPADWKCGNLLNIADYLNGLAMQKYRPNGNEIGLPVLKIKELRQGFCDENSELCSSNIKSEYIVRNGDVIFSWSGSLLVDIWCGGKCGLNQHLFKVTSEKYDKWFYYMWTKYHLEKFIAIATDMATTMGHIKRNELEKAEVYIPNYKDYQTVNERIKPLIDLIITNRIENTRLSALRDTLLPKLMNGEIDVSAVKI